MPDTPMDNTIMPPIKSGAGSATTDAYARAAAALAAAELRGARAMQAACLKTLNDLLTDATMASHSARNTIAIAQQDIAALDPAAIVRGAKDGT